MNLEEASIFHLHTVERQRRALNTVRLYRLYEQSFLTFLSEHHEPPAMDALNPQFVREWQSWHRAHGIGSRGGAAAERQGVVVLKLWARWLTDQDQYPADPLSRLHAPTIRKIKRKPYSQDEARRLMQAAATSHNPILVRALLLVLMDTGCRIGELCDATVNDLDMGIGTITFLHTKNGHPRTVHVRVSTRRDGGPCMVALRQWLKARIARDGIDTLFVSREGLPLSTRRAREIHAELGKEARVPNCHPHRWRHSHATELLAEQPGAELALRSRLGHMSRDILADYITQSDRGAQSIADVASLSLKWGL